MPGPRHADPTRMGDQPALRTSSGAIWLIVGGVLAIGSIVLLLALNALQSPLGLVGAGVILVLYVMMLAVTLLIRSTRPRLVTLATLMITIAVVALGFVYAINATEWAAV